MALLEKQLFTSTSGIPGSGLGLFTKQLISKDTLIVEYKGRFTTWSAVASRNFNGYIFYINRNHVIDALRTKSALARYANDAKGMGRVKGIVNNAEYYAKNKKAYVKSTKNIPAGAEIFVAYGNEYWDIVKENSKPCKSAKS